MKQIHNGTIAILSFLLVALFSWSFFQPSFFRVHDYTHVARLVEYKQALDAGQVPVHWSQNLGFGYGMPLFLFYGPLPSLVGTIFLSLGFSPVWSVKLVFFLAGVTAFTGMFAFLQRWGRTGAVVGAALLLAAPYRAVDIFVRGALNEALAIGILPWILHGLWTIPTDRRKGTIITSLSSAALLFTHNLTALMALPPLYLLGLIPILRQKKKRVENAFALLCSGILSIVLSVSYAVPAFIEKDKTAISDILSGYFDFRLHFLYIRQLIFPRWGYGGSEYGPNDGISFHLGFPLLALVGMAVGAVILRLILRKNHWRLTGRDTLILSFSAVSVLALFLTLTHSQPIWEQISLLSFIQFPWRFLALVIVLLSAVAGIGVSQVQGAVARKVIAVFALLFILAGQLKFHQPESFLETDDGYYYSDEKRIRTQMSEILPDYISKTLDRKLPPVDPENRIIVETATESRWELNRPHELLLFARAEKGGRVTWNIADFPGWEYFVNDVRVEPTLLPDGRRQMHVDDKIETVGARFNLTPLRFWTGAISLIGWVVLTVLAINNGKRHGTSKP